MPPPKGNLPMKTLVFASGNRGKLKELQALFAPLNIELRLQSEFGIESADETGATFVENALLKARHASMHSELPALADDSGIAVDALNGRPGIFSARYAGADASDSDNVSKLLTEMVDFKGHHRRCRFVCAMALLRHADDPWPLIALGSWQGRLLEAPRGEQGFGYDPVFLVNGAQVSAAELSPRIKNKVSHRAQAAQLMIRQIGASDLLDG